jgi:TniQ
MKPDRLTRHPAPFSTESLIGYALRLSELNGLSSIVSLFRKMGVPEGMITESRIDKEALSALTGHAVRQFEATAILADGPHVRILGHRLKHPEVSVSSAKFCPACAVDKGYIDVHFQLSVMVACPEHRCALLSKCPNCGDSIRWTRRGLLRCQCAQDLSSATLPSIGESEALLLDIVRRKLLGLRLAENPKLGLPSRDLEGMALYHLIGLIWRLGEHRLMGYGHPGLADESAMVHAAAEVLSDWPGNFENLLIDLGALGRPGVRHCRDPRFDSLLGSLFHIGSLTNMEHQAFIDDVIRRFEDKESRRRERVSDARARRWSSQMLMRE